MLKQKIESLLFISTKPLSAKMILNYLKKQKEEADATQVEMALIELSQEYNSGLRGIRLIKAGDDYQIVSSPENSQLVKSFLKEDLSGELTPASLETLTVVAYRGPITKAELEQIRGVNCSLILRNLLIRGMITAIEDKAKQTTLYQITVDFVKYLGIDSVEQLPDYVKLHSVENLEQYLNDASRNPGSQTRDL